MLPMETNHSFTPNNAYENNEKDCPHDPVDHSSRFVIV